MKRLLTKTAGCLAFIALATQTQGGCVSTSLSLPAHVNLTINETGCKNSGGPQVTVEGVIALGDICTRVILSNNAKGTHKAEVEQEIDLVLSLGEDITIPKQPSRGGVGGNPHIWIQFIDGRGHELTDEVYLGRCVQGLNVSADLLNEVLAELEVSTTGCSNNPGPWITLGGTVTLSGLKAKLIFRNNLKGTHTAEAKTEVTLIAEGEEITIPKQPSRGGVGGNPLISVQFIDCETGDAITDKVRLGRCNQLN